MSARWNRIPGVLIVVLGVLLMEGNGISGATPTLAPGTVQIYITVASQIVRVNDITGGGLTTLGSTGGVNRFNTLGGIFVDRAGRIYAADLNNDRIVRMNDMTGAGWTTLGAPSRFEQFNKPLISFNRPAGVFVDWAGRIYVADMGNGRIVRMNDMTGASWTTLGTPGTGVNQFNQPRGVFVNGAGRIYVADLGNNRIARVNDMTGAGWTTLGTPGHGVNQFETGPECGVAAVFVDGAGRIYVADLGNNRIARVNDMTGAGWTTLGTGGTIGVNRFENPGGIFVDGAGRIYVADFTRIVRMNDMTGAGWITLATPGTSSGIFVR